MKIFQSITKSSLVTDSNFESSMFQRYLTGHLCPDSVLFLRVEVEPSSGQFDMHSTLFVQDSNSREEKWEGPRLKPGLVFLPLQLQVMQSPGRYQKVSLSQVLEEVKVTNN